MTHLLPNQVYHVYNHANGEDQLFREPDNYRFFLDKYAYHIHPIAETFAYCLLPNHLHLMIKIRSEEVLFDIFKEKLALSPDRISDKDLQGFQNIGGLSRYLSQSFSNLFNAYTKAFNKKYDRRGSLFQPNFKRKHISNPGYYKNLLAYIHWNLIHHGLVNDVDDWLYSSWHAYTSEKPTRIARQQALQWFQDKETFFAFHRELKGRDVVLEFE